MVVRAGLLRAKQRGYPRWLREQVRDRGRCSRDHVAGVGSCCKSKAPNDCRSALKEFESPFQREDPHQLKGEGRRTETRDKQTPTHGPCSSWMEHGETRFRKYLESQDASDPLCARAGHTGHVAKRNPVHSHTPPTFKSPVTRAGALWYGSLLRAGIPNFKYHKSYFLVP